MSAWLAKCNLQSVIVPAGVYPILHLAQQHRLRLYVTIHLWPAIQKDDEAICVLPMIVWARGWSLCCCTDPTIAGISQCMTTMLV